MADWKSMFNDFAVTSFESKLQLALERVRVVLSTAKDPCFAGGVHHQYDDKYLLAECMTNSAAAAHLNCLSVLGLGAEQVAQLREWAKTSAVSLRLRSEERCTFLREETREVESPTQGVEELSVGGVVKAALTSKVVTKVTEYFWLFEVSYELQAIRGVGEQPADRISMVTRTSRDELKSSTKSEPRPEAKVPAFQEEVNVSWLFRQLAPDAMSPAFSIDRGQAKCHTPRRNPDVDAAHHHFSGLMSWADRCRAYVRSLLEVQPDPSRRLDLAAVDADPLVVSVMPLLRGEAEAPSSAEATEAAPAQEAAPSGVLACLPSCAESGALLSAADTNRLLAVEARALAERRSALAEAFPAGDCVASVSEAVLAMVLRHCGALCLRWDMAVDYIESLLRKQLIAAIGKEVSPADFAEYMCFHNRKLFADGYAPVPFCFAVRRSDLHAPEGTVSIEQEVTGLGGDSNVAAPIATLVARSVSPQPMSFPLNASTNVRFGGERYLHAWLSHQFSGQSGSKLSLVSRARQFSSMLVLIGRIASASTFEPKYAAIVQNKDELTIPLDLSTIPTPKEFKDAIESLSPEQQAFAKAFRAMQLESTLFGVLVIQIKPQLEKVLKLPADSLTKEIKLTQDLMQLFIKYQIPSDLLSYEDGCDADGATVVAPTPTEKLEAVKRHVQAMHEMIAKAKEEEVTERRAEAQYEAPEVRFADTRDDEADRGVRSRGAVKCRSAPMPGGKGGMALGRAMMAPMGRTGGKGGMPPPPACGKGGMPRWKGGMPLQRAWVAAAAAPAAAAASAPAPQASTPQTPTQQVPQQPGESGEAAAEDTAIDYTQVPKELDRRFELLDTDGALRPTIISPGETWTKRSQKALLAAPTTSTLQGSQKQEKDAAFDLLDALTKSGALPVDHAALHIVVAATHCFDKTVTETVVQDNTNPIDKVERSTLIMASTVHQKPAAALIRQAQYPRVSATSPMLFVEDGAA